MPTGVRQPMSPLRLGRIFALVGGLLMTWDTPTYVLLRFHGVEQGTVKFGLSACVWRGAFNSIGGLGMVLFECGSASAIRAAVCKLGLRDLALGVCLFAVSIVCFALSITLTTATNVLVMVGENFPSRLFQIAHSHKQPPSRW